MLFDTDILIWVERGHLKAAKWLEDTEARFISILTYMELIQGAADKKKSQVIKHFLSEFNVEVLPLTENIGHRASIYIEEYSLSTGLRSGDAIVAATAAEHNLPLATGNKRHFNPIRDLEIHLFRP